MFWVHNGDGAESVASTATPITEQKLAIAIEEDITTNYVWDTDLVVDGPRKTLRTEVSIAAEGLPDWTRPHLVYGTRVYAGDTGAVHFHLPLGEPIFERRQNHTVVKRCQRRIVLTREATLAWKMLQVMDGERTLSEIVAATGGYPYLRELIASLARLGAVDISDRATARFIHSCTKKGVLPGQRLDTKEILGLVTDGNYRRYPDASRFPVSLDIPNSLEALHALLISRRSLRQFSGKALLRSELEGLLTVACGVTGHLTWSGREVALRAYPSSGGLYAVEIYPVLLEVTGLPRGLYHYDPTANALEHLQLFADRTPILDASLPTERHMLNGIAAMICLTGKFDRHEQKYGEGGYRMLVAEAGHISQNLILAATAAGFSARPFGGVFDDLLNSALGLRSDSEQFLLSVIVGVPPIQDSESNS